MSDTNVGPGMAPHSKGCRCNECEVERLQSELRHIRAQRNEHQRCIVELEAERDDLRAERDSMVVGCEKFRNTIERLAVERDAARKRRTAAERERAAEIEEKEAALAALRKYGSHLSDCRYAMGGDRCTCGFERAKRRRVVTPSDPRLTAIRDALGNPTLSDADKLLEIEGIVYYWDDAEEAEQS